MALVLALSELKVGEMLIKLSVLAEAWVYVPLMVNRLWLVLEASWKVCPMVVVGADRPRPVLKVIKEEVPMVLLPWPNSRSLAARVTKAIWGEVPPLEVIEPVPVTAMTGEEVAINL